MEKILLLGHEENIGIFSLLNEEIIGFRPWLN